MADSKITALNALTGTNLATGDKLEWVDVSDTSMDASGTNKSMTADELAQAPVLRRARVLDEAHADAGSASSVAEQTLASLVLPGGIIAAGDTVRFVATGDCLNNSGSNVTYTWKFKIGSTTVLTTPAITHSTGTNRRKWVLTADIFFPTTASERVGATLNGTNGTSDTFAAAASGVSAVGYGTASEDTVANLNVILTCQLQTSASTIDVILHAATLTLAKK